MMRRFGLAVGAYIALCLIAMVVIVARGDGPHPRVVAVFPFNGDRYWPGGTAQIAFSQSMDQGSVERGLQVSPGSQGQGAWFGNILNLQPVGDWRPNVTYHVELVGNITDDEGRPLHTPVSFWFRVHHIRRLAFCSVGGVRNVCEYMGAARRSLTRSPVPVLQYALSSDGSILAYIRRDASGLPHLFAVNADGTGARQLTYGSAYADSRPLWSQGDDSSVSYYRRQMRKANGRRVLGPPHLWNVQIDGSNNAQLS